MLKFAKFNRDLGSAFMKIIFALLFAAHSFAQTPSPTPTPTPDPQAQNKQNEQIRKQQFEAAENKKYAAIETNGFNAQFLGKHTIAQYQLGASIGQHAGNGTTPLVVGGVQFQRLYVNG